MVFAGIVILSPERMGVTPVEVAFTVPLGVACTQPLAVVMAEGAPVMAVV